MVKYMTKTLCNNGYMIQPKASYNTSQQVPFHLFKFGLGKTHNI